jgi:HEAT repeat protein
MTCIALGSFPVSWAIVQGASAKAESGQGARDVATRVREILRGIRAGEPVSIEDVSGRLAGLGPTAIPVLLEVVESETLTTATAPTVKGGADSSASAGALEPEQMETVIAALSRFRRADLVGPLSHLLLESKRVRAKSPCLRVLAAVGDQRDLDLLCRAVRPRVDEAQLDPSTSEDFEAAVAGILERNETAFNAIKTCIRSEPAATRSSLYRSLSDTISNQGLEELGEQLGIRPVEDRFVLSEMARAAAWIPLPVPESIPGYVRTYLREDDPSFVQIAAECLGHLEDQDSIQALVPLLRHADPAVGHAAHMALRSITGINLIPDAERWNAWLTAEAGWLTDDLPRMTSEFRTGEEAARVAAISEMAAHPLYRRQITEILADAMAHDTPKMRRIACVALQQLGAASAIPFLEKCAQDPDRELARAARSALKSLPHRPGRPDLSSPSPAGVQEDGEVGR